MLRLPGSWSLVAEAFVALEADDGEVVGVVGSALLPCFYMVYGCSVWAAAVDVVEWHVAASALVCFAV